MKKAVFPVLVLCFLCCNTLLAQWKKVDLGLNVTGAGPVTKLSDRIIVETNRKLYYKLDTDTIWKPLQSNEYGLKRLGEKVIPAENTIMSFPRTSNGTVNSLYLSGDGGISWTERPTGLAGNPYPRDIALDADTMYMISFPPALYSTSDMGISWKQYSNPYKQHTFDYIAKTGQYIFAARPPRDFNDTVFAGVVLSSDYGASWHSANKGLGSMYVTFLDTKDSVVYAGTRSGIYASTNYGKQWVSVAGLPGSNAQFLAYEGDTLVACMNNQIYMSTDNGSTWSGISDEIAWDLMNPNTWINGLALHRGTVYVSTARGLFSTGDGGLHWKVERFEDANPTVLSLESIDSKLYAGTYNFGLYRSDDGGSEWARIDSNFSGDVNSAPSVWKIAAAGNSVFANPYSTNLIYAADQNTLHWKRLNTGFLPLGVVNITGITGYKGVLVISHYGAALHYSTDEGQNWARVDTSIKGWTGKCVIYADTLFAPTQGHGVLYSVDGMNWNNYLPFQDQVVQFVKNGSSMFVRLSRQTQFETKTYSLLSGDGGRTWDTVPYEVSDLHFHGTEILASFAGLGIVHSNDHGKSWSFRNQGMDPLDTMGSYRFVILGDTVFAYSGSNLFKDRLGNYFTDVPDETVRTRLDFDPPYPVPAGDRVRVNVYAAEPDTESIEIFNLSGEKVSASGDIHVTNKGGNGTITWNCGNMPDGTYLMKVRHSGATMVTKIVLTR